MTALNKELAPCPHCGGVAEFGRIDGVESPDFGGEFIQCTNHACAASSMLIFPTMADAKPLLLEKWNRRASTPSALPVEGAGWMPFALTLATALDRGDEAALLMDENSPLRDELRRLIAKERAITSGSAAEVKEAERDCMFTPGHADFERRQTFTAPIVGSWPWLRGCINGIPKREEFLGGQRTRYVQLDEVLGWIDEGERRAAHTSPAIVGTPSKEGAGQVEADGEVISAHHECATIRWFKPKGDPDNAWSWPVGGEKVYLAPAPMQEPDDAMDLADTVLRMRDALSVAVRQNSHDMLMTGEEIRQCEAAISAPPASPSEGVGEQIAHIKQAIYTISGGDFDATDDEARRIAEAVRGFSPSRGEAVDAAKELLRAVELEMSPEWECNSYHPAIAPAVERLKAAIQSQGAKP